MVFRRKGHLLLCAGDAWKRREGGRRGLSDWDICHQSHGLVAGQGEGAQKVSRPRKKVKPQVSRRHLAELIESFESLGAGCAARVWWRRSNVAGRWIFRVAHTGF